MLSLGEYSLVPYAIQYSVSRTENEKSRMVPALFSEVLGLTRLV